MWCLGWSYSTGWVPRCSGSPDKLIAAAVWELCCGNVHLMGHRLCVHSPEIQGWNFCEFPELVSVSCCLLFRWHAAFQALSVSCALVKQET